MRGVFPEIQTARRNKIKLEEHVQNLKASKTASESRLRDLQVQGANLLLRLQKPVLLDMARREIADLESEIQRASNQIKNLEVQANIEENSRLVRLQWTTGNREEIVHFFNEEGAIFFHVPAQRQFGISNVTGPLILPITQHQLTPRHAAQPTASEWHPVSYS